MGRAILYVLGAVMVGSDPSVAAAIARLETQLEAVSERSEKIEAKVDRLVTAWDTAQGGWKLVIVLGSLLGGIVTIAGAIWGLFHK